MVIFLRWRMLDAISWVGGYESCNESCRNQQPTTGPHPRHATEQKLRLMTGFSEQAYSMGLPIAKIRCKKNPLKAAVAVSPT